MQRDPQEFRVLARRCRERAKSSIDPAAIEQLRRWAVELADTADEIERNGDEPREATVHVLARYSAGDA